MSNMRPRMNRDQWKAVIEQQSQSELGIQAFCEKHDIGFASFVKWKKRLRDESLPDAKSTPTKKKFKAVQMPAPIKPATSSSSSIRLNIGDQITLTITTGGAVS